VHAATALDTIAIETIDHKELYDWGHKRSQSEGNEKD